MKSRLWYISFEIEPSFWMYYNDLIIFDKPYTKKEATALAVEYEHRLNKINSRELLCCEEATEEERSVIINSLRKIYD